MVTWYIVRKLLAVLSMVLSLPVVVADRCNDDGVQPCCICRLDLGIALSLTSSALVFVVIRLLASSSILGGVVIDLVKAVFPTTCILAVTCVVWLPFDLYQSSMSPPNFKLQVSSPPRSKRA